MINILVTGNFIPDEGNAPYKRLNHVVKKIQELYPDKTFNIKYVSLNKSFPNIRFIFLYPIFIITTFFRVRKELSKLNIKNNPTIIYFYGRNFSLLLPVYFTLKRKSKNILITDHVEHPLYLYGVSLLLSNLKFDQFIGYPLLWKFSDIGLMISKRFTKSLFHCDQSSIYFPIIINPTSDDISISNSNHANIKFLMVSSLMIRDVPELIVNFVNKMSIIKNVEIHILGRFKNPKLQEYLSKFSNVHLHNNASENVKSELFKKADYFVLFRNFRKAELYSSPTRLAEFLEYKKSILVNQSEFIHEVVGNTTQGYYLYSKEETGKSILNNLGNINSIDLTFYQEEFNTSITKLKRILDGFSKNYI